MTAKKSPSVDSNGVVVKKVSPYPLPIEIFLAEGTPPFKAQLWKLTPFGFLMKADAVHLYKVNENYFSRVYLPVIDHTIKAPIKVVKTYDAVDQIVDGHVVKLYTVEMHFRELDEKSKEKIKAYLVTIGQK